MSHAPSTMPRAPKSHPHLSRQRSNTNKKTHNSFTSVSFQKDLRNELTTNQLQFSAHTAAPAHGRTRNEAPRRKEGNDEAVSTGVIRAAASDLQIAFQGPFFRLDPRKTAPRSLCLLWAMSQSTRESVYHPRGVINLAHPLPPPSSPTNLSLFRETPGRKLLPSLNMEYFWPISPKTRYLIATNMARKI